MQVFSLLTLVLTACQQYNAQMRWEEVFDNLAYESTVKPAPRRDLAIGHDRDRNRIIIFGGRQTNSDQSNGMYSMLILFDDTWEFNLETRVWKQLSYSLDRPSARYGMLYTHSKYGLYISCGRNWIDFYNDLWIYDYSQDIWRKMDQTFISIVPEPRYSPIGGIYPSYEHSSDIKNSLFLGMGRSFWTMYSNLFAYSFSDLRALTGIWEMIYTDINTGPYSFTYPHGRTFASSTMISPDELLVHSGCLSGGFSGGPCPSADSWLFSYSRNRWDKVDSSCISPRLFSAMTSLVSDGFRQSAVMFSGLEKDKTILKTDYEKEDEVALYDSFARKWVRKRVQGFYFPEKRNGHGMCTGQYKNKYGAFMFGGYGHESDYNMADLWFLEVNISTVFDNPLVNDFYASNMRNNVELCSSYFSTIHLHAIVMFIGWGVFINIGTLISTYGDSKDERRHRIVSKIYRILQLIGLLFITAGIFLGFWSTNDIPHLAHLLIGLAAYILALLQPISSFLRRRTKKYDYYVDEHEKSKAEEYKSGMIYTTMKMIHENLNRSAIFLAIINISLGVFYAVFEWYWVLIWFCYLGAFIIIYLLFELNIYFSKVNRSSDKLSRSITSKSGQDDDDGYEVDGYDSNMSKSGSTQQLTSDGIQMQPIRYSTNSVNTSLKKDKNSKYSPSTPPPPYFINKGGKHQAFSTINLQGNPSQTSVYFQTTSSPLPNRKIPPTASSLGYAQDIELDEPIVPISNNNTPRQVTNDNNNYTSSRSIQNANQVYSIQTKYSPSSSLRSNNNKIEANLSYNIHQNQNDVGSYQNRMTQVNHQKSNINNNNNNNFKNNQNQRY